MKLFFDRNDAAFQECITSAINVDNLKQTAIKIKDPDEINGKLFDKCIRIDLMGMCTSLFFDRSHEVTRFDLYDALDNLILQTENLNKDGIFIKIRVLLLYPYCISALTRMNAEISVNRASISEPSYIRDFSILDEFTDATFWGASFNVTQQIVISQIKELKK